MRAMTAAMILASAGLLVACEESERPAPAAEETVAAAETSTGAATEDDTAADASASATPSPDASATPTTEPTLFNLPEVPSGDVAEDRAALTAIPARFLGQWDAHDGPCTPESEMFMTIRPGTITFYESQGEVTAVRRGRPGIVVTLAMQGEGENWTSEYGMALVKNSEQLASRELSASGTGTTRRRCQPEQAPATGQ